MNKAYYSGVTEDLFGDFALEDLASFYPQQWLAVAILEEDDGRPVKGYLLAHNQNRAMLEERIKGFTNQRILFFYSNPQNNSSQITV